MVDQTPVLQIFALGPPEVRLGEHLVNFPTRKTLALLVYSSLFFQSNVCLCFKEFLEQRPVINHCLS